MKFGETDIAWRFFDRLKRWPRSYPEPALTALLGPWSRRALGHCGREVHQTADLARTVISMLNG
jgi:hypothetical protein